mgnify:CR=1 FL=1
MKVFLTGGTGFIGSHFINELIRQKVEVKALRRNKKSIPRFPLISKPLWITKEIHEVTVKDLSDCDVLIHLAAHSPNVPYDNIENCISENVIKPILLFKIAFKAGIKKLLVVGTGFEYGEMGEQYDFIPTEAPLLPTQTYPASKAMASIAFRQLANENKAILSYQRIFHVYGEGEKKERFYPSLKFAAKNKLDFDMTKGEQVRDFIYVKDLTKILYQKLILLNEINKPRVIFENVGSGNPKSIKEFAEEIWSFYNAKGNLNVGVLPYREGEVMRYVPKI